MKKSHYSESKIIAILSQQEAGSKVGDICREHGISHATFFNWKAKYGGMSSNQENRLKTDMLNDLMGVLEKSY